MAGNAKRWFIACMTALLGVVLLLLVFWVFDPYFHFHRPFSFVSYRLYDERYMNDGISRHFDYDAVITGTSMAQNFKTSELDALFGTRSVKETFSGAGYQELSQNQERALKRNEALKTVIWALDYNGLIREKDWTQYEGYPEYLYDDNPWNDVQYVFNKSVLYHGVLPNIARTVTGQPSTTMDEYSSWDKETGLQYILQTYYVFYTPYSICYWDSLIQEGSIERQFEAEQLVTELLLQCPNVRLYNFYDRFDVITNLDNYRDKEHYAANVNSMILEWMAGGEGLVTGDNYLERLERERQYYLNYDYDGIYQN